jgi:hypothetical protein
MVVVGEEVMVRVPARAKRPVIRARKIEKIIKFLNTIIEL